MYLLECIASVGTTVVPGTRIPITATGVVFVGQVRSSQDPQGATLVALDDSTVTSGRAGHCRFAQAGGYVVLYDCESDNGTWIVLGDRPQRVGSMHSPMRIAVGTEIAIGRNRFRLLEAPA